jgi:hypothetical protein
MQAGTATRLEANVDRGASALFAAACAYAAYLWLATLVVPGALVAETAGAAAFAYVLSICMLGAVQPQARRLPVSVFDVRDIDMDEPSELSLTKPSEAWMEGSLSEPLLLDDVLSELAPDSRVVRLFDPAAMPTAGELKSRIDRHLDGQAYDRPSEEAVQALHDALAELRRSLR